MKEKIKNSIYGFIVGDALGVPYEFKQNIGLTKLEMVGYGTYNQPKGTWSDDTSFLLATMDSDLTNIEELTDNFRDIVIVGDYTPHGKMFDIGLTTYKNLFGLPSNLQDDNGSLMRILPYAFINNINKQDIINSSYITHKSPLAATCCLVYVEWVKQTLNGDYSYQEIFDSIVNENNFTNLFDNIFRPSTKGYVADSLLIVLDVIKKAKSYQEGVLEAINLGGDTDTHAALIGGVLAIKYDDFTPFINDIQNKELVDFIINKFIEKI